MNKAITCAISLSLAALLGQGSARAVTIDPDAPAVVLAANAPIDNTQTNVRDRSRDTLLPTDQPNNGDDVALAAAVRRTIVGDKSLSTLAHNVKLVAASGSVTLRGPVASGAEKQRVAQLASGVDGVVRVSNELDIKQ